MAVFEEQDPHFSVLSVSVCCTPHTSTICCTAALNVSIFYFVILHGSS
jgi:hypothetical protein